jgi:hypothetical protein
MSILERAKLLLFGIRLGDLKATFISIDEEAFLVSRNSTG